MSGRELLQLRYHPGSAIGSGRKPEESWRLGDRGTAPRTNGSEEERLGSCRVGPHRDEIEHADALETACSTLRVRWPTALPGAGSEAGGATNWSSELCGEPPLLLLDDVLAELDPITSQLALLEAVG